MSVPVTDSEETLRLLEQVCNGEPGARDALLARHRDALRRVVEVRLDRRVSARVDPSDVVQDVLLTAAGQLEDYLHRRPMSFRLWLRLAAVERIIQLHRLHLQAARRSVGREAQLP